jgi:large subunit ribosomal protein L2
MSVRKLKPITPGQRFRVVNGYDAITTDKPELDSADKKLWWCSQGKMTMRYTGGGQAEISH